MTERGGDGATDSWEKVYAEVARLPVPERQRLLARLLLDLAAEAEAAAAATNDDRPSTNDQPDTVAPSPDRPLASSPCHPLAPSPDRPVAGSPFPAPPLSQRSPRGPRPVAPSPPLAPSPHPRFIIDGSNFLGRVPGYDLASAQSREKLILRLQEFARRHLATRVVVFFDGKSASATTRAGVEVRFSPASTTADQQIVAFLRTVPKGERGEAVLVTEDAELAERARAMGVQIEAPLRFRQRIPDPPRPPADRGLNPAEVAEWEEYFRKGRNR